MSEKIIDVEVIKSTEDIDPKYSQYYSENAFWEKIKNVLVALGLKKIAYYRGYHNYRLQHNKANYQSIFR